MKTSKILFDSASTDFATAQCTRCSEVKTLKHFPDNDEKINGKSSWCRKCYREININNADKNILKKQIKKSNDVSYSQDERIVTKTNGKPIRPLLSTDQKITMYGEDLYLLTYQTRNGEMQRIMNYDKIKRYCISHGFVFKVTVEV